MSDTKSGLSFYTPSSSARSESSKKTSTSDDETQTSFEYLQNNTKEFFRGYPNIFDSDLKEFFKDITSEEEKYIDCKLLLEQILLLSGNVFSFLNKHGDLYNFWNNLLLDNINLDDIKLQQVEFLKDLMNGFVVYKKIKKPKKGLNYKAEDFYLILLGNSNKTVDDIFLKTPTDEQNKEIYPQAKILFNLREKIFRKLFNKEIIKNDSDQSDIEEYEESIAERIKLRKQKLDKIKEKEQNINNELFKKYFNYQSPSQMYNVLSDTKNAEKHNT